MAKTKQEAPLLSIQSCCETILDEAPSEYGKAYARAMLMDLRINSAEAKHVQILYILSNLSSWRGPKAREVKKALRLHQNLLKGDTG